VVIPCFNQGHFLAEALESVREQSLPPGEIIVVDDGSTDRTRVVAARYAVSYVSQPNLGLARARNRGLRAARGDFLVFLDADDRLRPRALEIGLRELEADPSAALVYGRGQRIDAAGRPLPTSPPEPLGHDAYEGLLQRNPIWTPGLAMFRRNVCGATLHFDPAVDASADYELYLRLARRHRMRAHAETVADYRQHPGSMSRNAALMLSTTLQVLHAQRRHLDTARRQRAYQEGLRNWRALYGDQVVDEVRSDWRDVRRWPALARSLAVLLRHYPAGLAVHARRKMQRVVAPPGETGTDPRPSRMPGA
jgi:glycosyltransferase involved in cell wall biosynthesis